ncbi:MAG: hypothetical protein AAF943_18065 [Pseudomonadota bacterium]
MRLLDALFEKHGPHRNFSVRLPSDIRRCTEHETRLVHRRPAPPHLPRAAENALRITCRDPSGEDSIRDAQVKYGQRLARQERWDLLSAEIARADLHRQMTPDRMPVADLLAFGARADVVNAVEHALFEGHLSCEGPLMDGIEALEHVLADHRGSPVVAATVAQTHIDVAWAWRGNAWDEELSEVHREAFEAHFDRAADILAEHVTDTPTSPFETAARCALLGAVHQSHHRVADQYEALIDLNHANPRPMRAMGVHLLPRWHGSYAELELEARRTASRTIESWGAGGYTWVQMDAIMMDDTACENLDLPFFIEGVQDILERCPDPATVNTMAAYCANGMGQSYSGNPKADEIRRNIAECAHWIVRNHLTELHPMIWAHAARGFANNLPIYSCSRFAAAGRDDAIRLIMSLFSSEIEAGQQIVFTDAGPITSV